MCRPAGAALRRDDSGLPLAFGRLRLGASHGTAAGRSIVPCRCARPIRPPTGRLRTSSRVRVNTWPGTFHQSAHPGCDYRIPGGGTRQRRVPRTRGQITGRSAMATRQTRPGGTRPNPRRCPARKASGRRARLALKRAMPASKRKRLRVRSAGIPLVFARSRKRRRAQGNRPLYAVSGSFAAVCCPVPARSAMNAGRRPAFAAAEARLI